MEVFLQTLAGFLTGAVLVETLTKIIGDRFVKLDKVILSMFMGVIVAFYSRFNVLEIVGLAYGWGGNPVMDYIGLAIGITFSGLILSTGSNGIHDLISKLRSAKELTQAKTEAAKIEAEILNTPTDNETTSFK